MFIKQGKENILTKPNRICLCSYFKPCQGMFPNTAVWSSVLSNCWNDSWHSLTQHNW